MKNQNSWRFTGKSVRGAYHIRAGLPNQDAVHWWPQSIEAKRGILSVSDGHGSAKCFRSHVGAKFAIDAAEKACKKFLLDPDRQKYFAGNGGGEENLSQEIVRSWKERVIDEISERPFTREEIKNIEIKEGIHARRKVVSDPIITYGATLLTLVITEKYLLYLQLGDGDILAVTEEGQVNRPLGKHSWCFANETTSLCLPHAWKYLKLRFQAIDDAPPALILLSTDGYSDSFAKEKEFHQVGPDILEMIRSNGFNVVKDQLESWLDETSRGGSGDDISLGIACRAGILRNQIFDSRRLLGPVKEWKDDEKCRS